MSGVRSDPGGVLHDGWRAMPEMMPEIMPEMPEDPSPVR